jgi:O-antigen/teichoic acid export membrane protein
MKARIQRGLTAMVDHGLVHVMVANLAQQAAAFLGVLLIAKLLAPDEFALVRVALAYMGIATVLAVGGLTTPILRYCADAALSLIERRLLLTLGIGRVLVISAVVTLGALGLVWAWPMEARQASVYSAYALQLPALALASLLLVYLQAIGQFKILAYYQVAIRVVTMVLSVGAAYFYGLFGFLVATLITVYVVCVPLLTLSRPPLRGGAPLSMPADFSKLAHYSVLGAVVTALGQYADVIMLDLVGIEKKRIAVYSLATIFFFSAQAVGGAVQSVATPMFTALIREPVLFKQKLLRWSVLLSVAAIPVSVALVLLGKAVETWFLGINYAGLSSLLAILMLKFFLWSTFAVGGAALLGVGAIKQGTWIAVLTTILSLAIGFPLCKQYGVYGAAWTQVVVTAVSVPLIWWVLVLEIRALRHRASSPSGRILSNSHELSLGL